LNSLRKKNPTKR